MNEQTKINGQLNRTNEWLLQLADLLNKYTDGQTTICISSEIEYMTY